MNSGTNHNTTLSPARKLLSFFSRKKKIAIAGILVALLGFFLLRRTSQAPAYTLEPAKREALVEIVSESGHVTTAGATPVFSTTTGMVEAVFIKNGDTVVKGAKLFSVKSTATKQEKDSALSGYLAAKAALDSAKATQLSLQATMFTEWDTFKELAESDTYEEENGTPKYEQRGVPEFHVPEKEWLSAEAAYKNQEQVVSQKVAALSEAYQAYLATQDSTVTAIFGGEIRNLGVTKGDLVTVPTVSARATAAPVLMLVDNAVNTTITVDVNEADILKIKEGQSATVSFDAIADKTFSATVERVDTIATASQDVISFSVYVVLNEDVEAVQRGMTADIDILVANKENTLTVPSGAVKPYQGGKAVRVPGERGEITFVPVETGSKGDGKIEILSGIEEGAEVITVLASEQAERRPGFFP